MKLQVIEFHILWNNQNEQRIRVLTKDKESGMKFIEMNTKEGHWIDKVYSTSILVRDIDYFDEMYVEVFIDE